MNLRLLEASADDPVTGAMPVTGTDRAAGRGRHRPAVAEVLAAHKRRRGGSGRGGGRGGSGGTPGKGLLSEAELRSIEETYADGITAVQVVDLFVSRGVRFSEATFRKYVQQGLVPRSKRVGRKGKHRGSLGVYPAKTVRRVNAVKRLMSEGYTIEEIQDQFLRFTDVLESIEESTGEFFSRMETEVAEPRFDARTRRDLKRDLNEARRTADDLLRRLDDLARKATKPARDQARTSGAAGSAEDLL